MYFIVLQDLSLCPQNLQGIFRPHSTRFLEVYSRPLTLHSLSKSLKGNKLFWIFCVTSSQIIQFLDKSAIETR